MRFSGVTSTSTFSKPRSFLCSQLSLSDTTLVRSGDASSKRSSISDLDNDQHDHSPLDEDGFNTRPPSSLPNAKWYKGWRFGVRAATGVALMVFSVNLSLTVWAWSTFPVDGGIAKVSFDTCSSTEKLSLTLHIAINALSSAILGASTYCMQCVYAPTRHELDNAHGRGDWMEVGTTGLRNVSRIPRKRGLIWVLLALSSLPFHLLYNSAVIKVVPPSNYGMYLVSEQAISADFVENPWNTELMSASNADELNYLRMDIAKNNAVNLERQSVDQCIMTATSRSAQPDRIVVVVSNNTLPVSNSGAPITLLGRWSIGNNPLTTGSATFDVPGCYKCSQIHGNCTPPDRQGGFAADNNAKGNSSCGDLNTNGQQLYGWWNDFSVYDTDNTYCLVSHRAVRCDLLFSLHILVIISVVTAVKSALMASVLYVQTLPLITVGDAIASYLTRPDLTTKYMCLMSKEDTNWLRQQDKAHTTRWKSDGVPPMMRHGLDALRYKIWCRSSAGFGVLCFAVWLAVATKEPSLENTFGTATPSATMSTPFTDDTFGMILTAVLVNSPQMLLSLLYVSTTSIVSCMALCEEWSRFAIRRRGLRTSETSGDQRSTYWLSIPFRYSIPLLIIGIFHHWILSSSCFLVRFPPSQEGGPDDKLSNIGWGNPAGTIFCITNVLVFGAVYMVGLRRLASKMPIAAFSTLR